MELQDIFLLYRDTQPASWRVTDSSHGEADFRQAVFAEWPGEKLVIKITANDFTSAHRVECWQRLIEAYIESGYYCPRILNSRSGRATEEVLYSGRTCVVYAEELSKYTTAETREEAKAGPKGRYAWRDAALESIGVIGSKMLTCADFPSGYCILEKFAPSDPCDEVMETALRCRELIGRELMEYRERFGLIWQLFEKNRRRLEEVYAGLPTSVFQADLNSSNILADEEGRFAGLIDFNICGRDTVINYLFREAMVDFDEGVPCDEVFFSEEADRKAVESLLENIGIVRRTYAFSEAEIAAAPLLYRYLRPFWWNTVRMLDRHKDDREKISRILNWIEKQLIREDIDFAGAMRPEEKHENRN